MLGILLYQVNLMRNYIKNHFPNMFLEFEITCYMKWLHDSNIKSKINQYIKI